MKQKGFQTKIGQTLLKKLKADCKNPQKFFGKIKTLKGN